MKGAHNGLFFFDTSNNWKKQPFFHFAHVGHGSALWGQLALHLRFPNESLEPLCVKNMRPLRLPDPYPHASGQYCNLHLLSVSHFFGIPGVAWGVQEIWPFFWKMLLSLEKSRALFPRGPRIWHSLVRLTWLASGHVCLQRLSGRTSHFHPIHCTPR